MSLADLTPSRTVGVTVEERPMRAALAGKKTRASAPDKCRQKASAHFHQLGIAGTTVAPPRNERNRLTSSDCWSMSVMAIFRQLVGFYSVSFGLWSRDRTIGCNVVSDTWPGALLEAKDDPPDETSGIGLGNPRGTL